MPTPPGTQLDYGLLLIAHLVCADEQIHIQEIKALQSLVDQLDAKQMTRKALDAILSHLPEAPALEELTQQILPGQQIETLKQLLAFAYIDDHLAPQEELFIQKIAGFWNIPVIEIERLQLEAHRSIAHTQSILGERLDELSLGAQLLKGTETVLSRALIERLTEIAPKSLSRQIHKLQKEILLAGPEYDAAISKCAKVAQLDYQVSASGLRSAYRTLDHLNQDLQDVLNQLTTRVKQEGKSENLKTVLFQLEETRQNLNNEVFQELKKIQASLKAKQRSLKYFTIACMGKTKAGKSTLHAILTDEGWDAVGVGMQRTTRYNRVYEWKNIRIIDTPGIGAPGGKSDEEIAKSVLEEADVICYVVTNDSVQETEFEFLKTLKEHTKPLTVLLNLKSNLRDSRRLEHFIRNPDKIFLLDGKSGIGGHIERIKRYAKEHYRNGYLDIIPVMLLAAQISREAGNKSQAKKLFQASRIKSFLDSLRIAIIEYGPIRRSQTLLGSTVYSIEKPQFWAKEQAITYKELAQIITKKGMQLQQEFREALDDSRESLVQRIQSIFSELSFSVDAFANEYWEASETELTRAWKNKLQQYNLEKRIKMAVEESQQELVSRMRDSLEEVGTDLKLLSDFNMGSNSFSQAAQNLFEKNRELLKLGGMLLLAAPILLVFPPLAAFAPLLTSLAFAGTAITFLTSKLKSKDKRRSEAAAHIRQQLIDQLTSYESKVTKKVQQQFEQVSLSTANIIGDYFKQLSQGLEKISQCLETTDTDLNSEVIKLNHAYAERIIEWASGKRQKIRRVERIFGKQIEIWPSQSISLNKSLEEISQILQEEIIIY